MIEIDLKNDRVVLLHGIARTSRSMHKLAQQLQTQGCEVLNIDYPSRKHTIPELVDIVAKQVELFNAGNLSRLQERQQANTKIHFIGHSMGNLIIRGILSHYRPNNLGRIVMLAPPNHGSEVADFFKNFWLYQKIYGPAGQQLITNLPDLRDYFTEVDYSPGVIASDFGIDPVCSWFLLPGKDDGKVTVASTKIQGMADHIVICATHSFMPSNKIAIEQTLYFLHNGNFSYSKST